MFNFFQGGTTDTGNNARKWFSYEKRAAIVALGLPRNDEEEENLTRLLQFTSVVWRVANTTQKVNVPFFKKFV